jgi:hypothetical protein
VCCVRVNWFFTDLGNINNYLLIPANMGVSYSEVLTQKFLRINTERKKLLSIQFEVITAVAMKSIILYNMTLHILIEVYRRFRGTYYQDPQIRRVSCIS